ncbi:MAG TPA: hypothetical protein VF062_17460 [Candidatus Limnocylindrales bacterium]
MTTADDRIVVDLQQLNANRDGLRRDTDEMLGPGTSDAHGQIFRGLHVGDRSQSGEVESTRRALAYAMDRFWDNGVAQVERARRLVEFLDKVLAEYTTAEDFAKLNVDKVLADLETAMREPTSTPPTTIPKGHFE